MDRADSSRGLRVLAVDDNRDAADSLRFLAELWGHEARAAYDGPAGLAAAADFRPDILFLDLGLPTLDGFEVARRLRAAHSDDRPALVALTGYADPVTRDLAAAAGFDHVMVKPADPAAVRQFLDDTGRLLRLARTTRDLIEENAHLVRRGAELARDLRQTIRGLRDTPPDRPDDGTAGG